MPRGAKEGVEVNVLLDAIGTAKMERGVDRRRWRTRACASRASARSSRTRSAALNNRTHRKLLVADGRVGMTGGVGIAEEWTGNAEDPDHWRDTHVRVRGPVVRGLQGAFAENWLEATGEVLVGDALPARARARSTTAARCRSSAPSATVGDTDIEALYFLAIASARDARSS